MVSNPGFACHDKARMDTPRGRGASGSAVRAGRGLSRHVLCRALPHRVDEIDLLFYRLIDEEYTRHPFFGSRKRVVFLKTQGHIVNRKRVQRLMRAMSLAAPGPNTSRAHSGTRFTPICCAGCPWSGRTRCGARTSPTSGGRAASSTWWRSSTGTRAEC